MEKTNNASITPFARRRKNLVDRCSKDVDRIQQAYKVYNVANMRATYQKKQAITTKKKIPSAKKSAHVSITDPLKLGLDFKEDFFITTSSSDDSDISEITIPVHIRSSAGCSSTYCYEKRSNLIKTLEHSVNTYHDDRKMKRIIENIKRDSQNKENTRRRDVLKSVRQQYRTIKKSCP